MKRNKLFIIGCLVCFLTAGCHDKSNLPYYNTADFTPIWDPGSLITSLHTIPSFSFIDQNNQTITEKSFDEKIYIANFFFTRCGVVCPKMTRNLIKVQNAFVGNSQLAFLSHSVTPVMDSVTVLNAYAKKFALDQRWHLVTGDEGTIYKLARQAYFAEEELGFFKNSTEFLHTEHILLIDRHRHIRGVYNGTLELEMERMIKDISLLLRTTE